MTGSTLRAILLAVVCFCTVVYPAISDGKPNVIVIMADDIGFECYSGYGSQFYSTPNIDRLAETGARFTQAYAQPICTPSRTKIMTGRYNLVDMVAYMDKTIGRIVTKLDELGLRENTLILVTGDNGTNKSISSPFPGRGQIKGGKGTTTDAGTRVAFGGQLAGTDQAGHCH